MEAGDLIVAYKEVQPLYLDFTHECERLVNKLLAEEGLAKRIHAVSSRPKGIGSLWEKTITPGKTYRDLSEITDLAGVRVITYFADDVDLVARMLEREFIVDQENSVDKRRTLAPEAFGYLSVHYVCRLSSGRVGLPENARFNGLACEIQIRSILQHAWAEIEHDLGYKSIAAVPSSYRRRFSRLAGVFEMADDEFMRLRESLAAYAQEVAREITEEPSGVEIDKDSLTAYVSESREIEELDSALAAEVWHSPLVDDVDAEYLQLLIPLMQRAGMTTIEDLQIALRTHGDTVVAQTKRQHGGGPQAVKEVPPVPRGASLFRLTLLLLSQGGSEAIVEAFNFAGWNLEGGAQFADEFVNALPDITPS